MNLTPEMQRLCDLVDSLPIEVVKAHFAEGEIDSIAKSENRVYDDEAIRWQLACDLRHGDKTLVDPR